MANRNRALPAPGLAHGGQGKGIYLQVRSGAGKALQTHHMQIDDLLRASTGWTQHPVTVDQIAITGLQTVLVDPLTWDCDYQTIDNCSLACSVRLWGSVLTRIKRSDADALSHTWQTDGVEYTQLAVGDVVKALRTLRLPTGSTDRASVTALRAEIESWIAAGVDHVEARSLVNTRILPGWAR